MLALMLTLPWETARRVPASIGLPVLRSIPLPHRLGLLLASRLRRERVTANWPKARGATQPFRE